MLVLLLLTAMAQGVWGLSGSGTTKENPILIKNETDWKTLADNVSKKPNDYANKYIKLGANIKFTNADKCKPIGTYDSETNNKPFLGHFDGDGKTISDFTGPYDCTSYAGLFGYIGSGATVENFVISGLNINVTANAGAVAGLNKGHIEGIIVSESSITVTNNKAGGIAGNNYSGIIKDCHVLRNVTMACTYTKSSYFGGIVGYNSNSTVSNCSNAATIAYEGSSSNNITYYGGIAGFSDNTSTIENCLYLGGKVVAKDYYGSIAGNGLSNYSQNYYTQATTGGVANENKPDNDGAVPALRNDKDNTKALELLAARNTYLTNKGFSGNCTIKLYGRTLYKDGHWNTLCLPFDVTIAESLKGATVKTLGSSSFGNGTLTLNFEDATIIEAGKPYIIKWTKPDPYTAYNGNNASTCSDIVNPSFTNINIKNVDAPKITDEVIFQGTFSPQTLTANDNTVLYLGANSTLYYPSTNVPLNAFRAYFKLKGLTAGEPTPSNTPGVRAFVLNFGDGETSGIVDAKANPSLSEWYSLSGRRYATPTVLPKGVYIHNGRKFVVK